MCGSHGVRRENLEIVMVDKASHFEFICTNYKSLCDDDIFDYLTVSNQSAMESLNRDLTKKSGSQTETTESEYKPVYFI